MSPEQKILTVSASLGVAGAALIDCGVQITGATILAIGIFGWILCPAIAEMGERK